MPDGTLPNARIRESVLRLLGQVRPDIRRRGKVETRTEASADTILGMLHMTFGRVGVLLQCAPRPAHPIMLPSCQSQLPVDTALEDRKEQLKRSGLGRVVMFYFKLPGAQSSLGHSAFPGDAPLVLSSAYALSTPACRLAPSSSQPALPSLPTRIEGPDGFDTAKLQMRLQATAGWPRSWWSGGADPSWPPPGLASSAKRRVPAVA